MDQQISNELIQVAEVQIFPCISYIKALVGSIDFKIELYESFQKMSFRNRYIVTTANGVVSLTVPLKNGREQKLPIRQVEIDNSQNWRQLHWKTIVSSYSKAPFFEYYQQDLKDLIFSEERYLFDYDVAALNWIRKILKINTSITFTDEFLKIYPKEDLQDLRNKWLPKNFQEGVDDLPVKYNQVFESRIGFQLNVSIIDLLFNEGPNTRNILESSLNTI